MQVDLNGVRAVIDAVCDSTMEDMPAEVPVAHEAAMHGAAILRDNLREALAIEEWEEMEATEVDDMRERVERYCYGYCIHGQQLEPGGHPRCSGCPLVVLTAEALARQVARAKEED